MAEHDLARLLRDFRVSRSNVRLLRTGDVKRDVREQAQSARFGHIPNAFCRTRGLRRLEYDSSIDRGVASVAIEHHTARLDMNRVLRLSGGRLISNMRTLGIRFQINYNCTLGRHIAGSRVVLEVSASDAVEAAG